MAQHFISQLADLFDGSNFGFMSGAALGHGLIDHIGDAEQPATQVRTMGETFIQTWLRIIFV